MEIKYEITEEDYIQFNLYHVQNSPSQKKTYNLLRYGLPLLFSVPVYAIGTSLFKQPKAYWIGVAIFFIVGMIITYPYQYKRLVKRATKKFIQEGDNSSVFGKKTMVIDDDNIKVTGEFTSETISKKSIKTVKVYEDMILMYLSAFTAEIIPTRYLNDESKEFLMKEFGMLKNV